MNALAIRERVQQLPRYQKLLLVLGGVSLVFLVLNRKKVMTIANTAAGVAFDFAKAEAFKLSLPTQVARWAPQILSAAQKYNVDPWVLALIMYRESLGGDALTPPGKPASVKFGGPAGTGDFIPRKPGSAYFKYADPATGLPPDGLGWGRGLMQVDYGVHIDWFRSGANWQDPQVNINKGAELFAEKLRFFSSPSSGKPINVEQWRINVGRPEYRIVPWAQKYPRSGAWPTQVPDVRPLKGQALYEAAIAAYNVSYTGVQQAIGLGLPAEAGTTGQDYVSSALTKLAAWQKNFR